MSGSTAPVVSSRPTPLTPELRRSLTRCARSTRPR
jgi:hypothetical protein